MLRYFEPKLALEIVDVLPQELHLQPIVNVVCHAEVPAIQRVGPDSPILRRPEREKALDRLTAPAHGQTGQELLPLVVERDVKIMRRNIGEKVIVWRLRVVCDIRLDVCVVRRRAEAAPPAGSKNL